MPRLPHPPIPHAFLSSRFSRVRSATTIPRQQLALRDGDPFTSSGKSRGACRVAGKPPFAGLKELFRPAIVHPTRRCPRGAHSSATLSSPRSPSSTTRIFSSAEKKCRRVARRMSLIASSRRLLFRPGFLSHLRSLRLSTMIQKSIPTAKPPTVSMVLTPDTVAPHRRPGATE